MVHTQRHRVTLKLRRLGYHKISDDRRYGRDVLTYRRRVWVDGCTQDTIAQVYRNGSVGFAVVTQKGIIGL